MSGFVNPIIMTEVTGGLDEGAADYKEQLREKWSVYFYVNALVELWAVLAVLLSVCLRRREWVKHKNV